MKKFSRKRVIGLVVILILIVVFVQRCTFTENSKRVFIKDKYGRSLILHGVNVNADAKSDPLRVGWPQEQDYADLSEKWGFNFVRYLVLWDGIEPEKGKYDTGYFERIRQRLDWSQKHHLKVVLDMHQDLYALRFGGDGAPEWAIHDDGQPFELQTPWELNYRQPAVIASINNFWDTTRGYGYLQEHYIKAFVEMVKAFKDHPAVIGYDLYNEPTMATDEAFAFEEKYLKPFYDRLIRAIREEDTVNWIFYEPTALGCNQGLRTSLGVLKDYRKGEPRLVYFPHIYTIDLDIKDEYIGFPVFVNLWGASSTWQAKKQKAPMLVGEFGLNVTKEGSSDYLRHLMKMFDKITSGWAYWAYMKNDSWSPFHRKKWTPFLKEDSHSMAKSILVRPYPQAVAGHPVSYGFDNEKKRMWLTFIPDKTVKLPTVIYLSKDDYPDGWDLKINLEQGSYATRWDEDRRLLYLTVKDTNKKKVVLEVLPAKENS
jgi:endoglycosylceramidase